MSNTFSPSLFSDVLNPLPIDCKTLMTIHDVRGMHFEYNFLGSLFYKFILNKSLQNTSNVITVSNFMKNDILKHCPNIKISTIYNGIDLKEFRNFSKMEPY